MSTPIHTPERRIVGPRLARQIPFGGGRTLTLTLEALHSSDGKPTISRTWEPSRPERMTVDQAEALHTAVIRTTRELLDEHEAMT